MTQLAIVVPCYNEQEVLPETSKRLIALLHRLQEAKKIGIASHIYFVDDGSRDATWSIIQDFVKSGLPVIGIKLSRNQGHQNALLAGLFSAEGDAIVSIDADLQDDIEIIEKMVDYFQAGCDIVYGVRKHRNTDTFFKRFTAEAFYKLFAWMGAQTIYNHADYRLMSRRAIESLKEYREVNLFLRGIIPLIGFRSEIVEYDRTMRFAGESKYPLKKMIALALNAITSFSVFPLRVISFLGLLIFSGTMLVTAWALWSALFTNKVVPGWASTVLPLYFLGGIQLLSLGIIGEYLSKIYIESKLRPRYFIEKIIGTASVHRFFS